MKLMNKVGSLFSKASKRTNKRKPNRSISKDDPRSFGSSTASSSSSSLSPPSSPTTVLRRHRGNITKEELEHVLRRLGSDIDPLTEEEVGSVIEEAMSLEDSTGTLIDELRDAFGVFDENGDGKISAEELRGVFVILEGEEGEGCGIEECRRMIESVDSDGDGLVCFDDFVKMMTMTMTSGGQR